MRYIDLSVPSVKESPLMAPETGDDVDTKTPYVAGALDWGGSLTISINKNDSYSTGFAVVTQIRFQKASDEGVGIIDQWCEERDIYTKLQLVEREDRADSWLLTISRQEDLFEFLEHVGPYLVVRREQAIAILERVRPLMESGAHQGPDRWMEFIEAVEYVREKAPPSRSGDLKYGLDYFRENPVE